MNKKAELQNRIFNEIYSIINSEAPKIEQDYFNQNTWMVSNRTQIDPIVFKEISRGIESAFQSEFYRIVKKKFELNIKEERELKDFIHLHQIIIETGVRKNLLTNAAYKVLDIVSFDRVFIPDILVHNHYNAENQILIIELKTDPELVYSEFEYDINKLVLFITKYKYENAIFLSANISDDKIAGFFKRFKRENPFDASIYSKLKVLNIHHAGHNVNLIT